MLTQTRLKELFDYREDGALIRKTGGSGRGNHVGAVAGTKTRYGYISVNVDGKLYQAHRLVWLWHHGKFPTGETDHMNGIRDDNRIENLRDVSRIENQQNQRQPSRNNKAKALGVHAVNGKYRAVLSVSGKNIYGVLRDSVDEAKADRVALEKQHFPSKPAFEK